VTPLRLVLFADGPSDRALLPVINWSMRSIAPEVRFFEPDFRVHKGNLDEVRRALSVTTRPDIVFVHRDAEKQPLDERRKQIPHLGIATVRVVPVRMTEAWLLSDEASIRKAAGNPNGRVRLDMPRLTRLEELPGAKETLRQLLLDASEHVSPRRQDKFRQKATDHIQRVSENTEDFSPLRRLSAFQAFEADLRAALDDLAEASSGRDRA